MARNEAQFESDPDYRELRKQIVDKEFKSSVLGTAGTLLLAGGIALAALGAPLVGPVAAIAAGGAAGVVGMGCLVSNFRRSTELQMDYEELNMRRRANYMSQVIERAPGRADPALAMAMDAQLDGGTTRWRDHVKQQRQQGPAVSAGDVVSAVL